MRDLLNLRVSSLSELVKHRFALKVADRLWHTGQPPRPPKRGASVGNRRWPQKKGEVELRYPKGQKRESYDRIVKAAAVQLKKHGPRGVGIADLMREAGLTHGGFYSHFRSRDDLVNKAFAFAMDQTTFRWNKLSANRSAIDGLEAIVRAYLCVDHRDHPGRGCALPTFAAEIGRADKATRKSFSIKLEQMVNVFAAQFSDVPAAHARQLAIAAICTMMGALSLSRASAGQNLSAEIPEAGVKSITAR